MEIMFEKPMNLKWVKILLKEQFVSTRFYFCLTNFRAYVFGLTFYDLRRFIETVK